MMLPQKIHKFIQAHHLIDPQEKVLVAYSGGADSTCLLLVLTELYENVAAVYVNHQLRGTESAKEAAFVRKFCEDRKITIYFETIHWNKRPSDLEQAARKRRYRHLAKVAAEYDFQKVALAHHRDDVVETFLLHLVRGSGPKGLEGLRPQRGLYIRPMLVCTRREILAFLKKRRISYFTDTSNRDLYFRRNRLRHKLIPYIEKHFNPAFQQSIQETAKWIHEQNQLLLELLQPYREFLTKEKNGWTFERQKWLQLPPVLRKAVLKMILEEISPERKIQSRTLLSLVKAMQENRQMELPGFMRMEPSEESVRFTRKQSSIGLTEVDVPFPGEYHFGPGNARLSFSFTTKAAFHPAPGIAYLDADKASFPLYIRNWKKGDSFQPLGMTGRKKLSDYWIDGKVPRELRKTIPLVFKDDDLIWMAGYQIHEQYKVSTSTKRLLRIELKKDA